MEELVLKLRREIKIFHENFLYRSWFMSLKETEQVFLQRFSFLRRIFVAGGSLSGDGSGISYTTLHHKSDLEFGFLMKYLGFYPVNPLAHLNK